MILGIETSCDDSAAAILDRGGRVLSNKVSSQIQTHAEFGGVVPEIAAREHLKALYPLTELALKEAKCKVSDIEAIAVTQGPGLIGSLLIGVTFAKALSRRHKIPLLPVNHVHAHIHGAFLSEREDNNEVSFPCLAAVVSGGHCNLYYMENPCHFSLLAMSVDDACGESFDKVAKMLGFGYPGGPVIERLARSGDPDRFPMPRMVEQKSRLAFSYSGLKTHMVNLIRKLERSNELDEQAISDLCAGFQNEAFDQLSRKIKIAAQNHPDAKSIVIAGGVAANQFFKGKLSKDFKHKIHFPKLSYCSDNAAMIAAYGQSILKNDPPDRFSSAWDAYSRYNFREFMHIG